MTYEAIPILALLAIVYFLYRKKRNIKPVRPEYEKVDVEIIPDPNSNLPTEPDEKIIGVIKPVGFWTKKVFAEHIHHIRAMLNMEEPAKGYWQRYVESQHGANKKSGKDR